MTKKPTIESIPKRLFARHLKEILLGYRKEKPEHSKVADEFYELFGYQLSKSNWHYYWTGQYFPTAGLKSKINEKFLDVVDLWTPASRSHNRLVNHLYVLDLAAKAKDLESEALEIKARKILELIHREWRPLHNKNVDIYLGVEKLEDCQYDFNEQGTEQFSDGFEGIYKTNLIEHQTKLSKKTLSHYELLNPASIIQFLLCYAMETKVPYKGLRQAVVFDFLTALIAMRLIIYSTFNKKYADIDSSSLLMTSAPQIVFAESLETFWYSHKKGTRPSLKLDFENTFEKLKIEDSIENLELLQILRLTYYSCLGRSGLSEKELSLILEERLGMI